MRHHYWEWPIASYLFLGGLGGGIYFLAMIMDLFVFPREAGIVMAWPGFIGLVCLALGCFLLVFELGQPGVFYRAFVKSTSIICWGARLLSICLIFGLFWFVSFIPWQWFSCIAAFFAFFRMFNLVIAGIAGFGIMVYTGLMFSTLKAHSFWATPALPVLFTVSALSTACAAIMLSIGWWPAAGTIAQVAVATEIHEILHLLDIILIFAELTILLLFVLSLLGAGNVTAHKVAARWVKGKTAPFFWFGMVGIGLVIPELMNIGAYNGTALFGVIAPVLALCGGLLLRFLFVYADDRKEIPGETKFFTKLPSKDAQVLHAWKQGENLY